MCVSQFKYISRAREIHATLLVRMCQSSLRYGAIFLSTHRTFNLSFFFFPLGFLWQYFITQWPSLFPILSFPNL